MHPEINLNTLNNEIILNGIYIPHELFGRIVDCLKTHELWQCGLVLTCRSFYIETFGTTGLFARRVESDSTKIVTDIRQLKDAYENEEKVKSNYFCVYNHKHPNLFFDVIGKLFFCHELISKCVENRMFTHPCSTRIAISIFKKAIEGDNSLLHHRDTFSFSLLTKSSQPVEVKINFISFWIALWETDLDTRNGHNNSKLRPEIARALNLILFGTSNAASLGAFDGHFSAPNLWVQHPDFLEHPLLLNLKINAWNCLKTCQFSENPTLKAELAIAAGLLCLSNHFISPELQSEALAILTSLSYSKSALVLKHIANTIILLNTHTEGGFYNLSNEVQSILITIFHRLLHSKQTTVVSKVNEIDLFINCSDEDKTPLPMDFTESDYIVIEESKSETESDTEEPAPKRLKTITNNEDRYKNEKPFIVRQKRPRGKENIVERPIKKQKQDKD